LNWKRELGIFAAIAGIFCLAFWLPVDSARLRGAVIESLKLVRWYAREHVLLCLVPAFFIAGAISCFVNQGAVLRYLGAGANKVLAYGVAAVSGSILAVCSCTVLPIFAGVYKRGAGLGPASAFLYSGPAINVLAIVLTARVLGMELGVARAVGAVLFSVLIGLVMHLVFRREEQQRAEAAAELPVEEPTRPLWKNAVFFAAMVGVLVFANWGRPADASASSLYAGIYRLRFWIAGAFLLALGGLVPLWFKRRELGEWGLASWGFAKQITPLLAAGVVAAGLLLGAPGSDDGGLVPKAWVESMVSGNSIGANAFAAVAGALMYFATLTEVPILEGLIKNGMGRGPALALLLAGPALSLPNMLVIRSVMGTKKTAVFVCLVVVMATASGMVFGAIFG
jgi:uncharacterized membrane protein YraQ (UPF0718 family)